MARTSSVFGGGQQQSRASGGSRLFPSSTSAAPTREELEALARRIGETDPSLLQKALETAKGTALSVGSKALKTLDIPRKEVFKFLFNKETGEELFKDIENPIARGAASFTTEVLLDPLVWLSAGAAGVGRTAIKAALTKEVTKEFGKKAGARKFGKEVTLKQAQQAFDPIKKKSILRPGTVLDKEAPVSTITKRLAELPGGKEFLKDLPGHMRGGIGLQVPFMPSTRHVLVPGSATSKLTAPVAEFLQLRTPGARQLAKAVTPGAKAKRDGFDGFIYKALEDEARSLRTDFQKLHADILNAVGLGGAKKVGRSFRVSDLPTDVPAEVRLFQQFDDAIDEFLEVAKGTFPASAKARRLLSEMWDATPEELASMGTEAQRAGLKALKQLEAKMLEIGEGFGVTVKPLAKLGADAPHHDLFRQFSKVTDNIALRKMAQKAEKAGVLNYTFDTVRGVELSKVKAAGFRSVDDAIRYILQPDGLHHVGMQRLARESPETFKELKRAAEDVRGDIDVYLGEQIGKKSKQIENLPAKAELEETIETLETARIFDKSKEFQKQIDSKIKTARESLEKRQSLAAELENLQMGLHPTQGTPWPIPKAADEAFIKGAFDELRWVKLTGTDIPQVFRGALAPKNIADEIVDTFKKTRPDELLESYDRFIGVFRKLVTVPFPGFHLRNLTGAWFNNFLGGVTTRDYNLGASLIKAGVNGDMNAKVMTRKVPGIGKTGRQLWEEALEQGIVSPGQFPVLGETVLSGLPPTVVSQAASATRAGPELIKRGSSVAMRTERFVRMAAFMRGQRTFAGNSQAARAFVMVRHGDYGDLTPFERNLRRVIPFYKWMRMNIPFQMTQLAERPGQVLKVKRFQDNLLSDPEEAQEFRDTYFSNKFTEERGGFLAGRLTAPLGEFFGEGAPTHLVPDLPFFDLNELNPADIAARTVGGAAVEFTSGRSLFSGNELKETFIPKEYGFIKGLANVPGVSHFFSRSAGGELMVDRKFLSILNSPANPMSRFLRLAGQLGEQPEGSPRAQTPLQARLASSVIGARPDVLTERGQELSAFGAEGELDEMVASLFRREFGPRFKEIGERDRLREERRNSRERVVR